MKTLQLPNKLIGILLLTACVTFQSFAQSPKYVLERRWLGVSQQSVNFTENGYIYFKQYLEIVTLYSDNSFYGKSRTIMNLDGVDYESRGTFTGTFYPDTWELYLNDGTFSYTDALPYGLYWLPSHGRVKIYSDSDRSGGYIMKGTVYTSEGSPSDLELASE
jgi:hypothetical protein